MRTHRGRRDGNHVGAIHGECVIATNRPCFYSNGLGVRSREHRADVSSTSGHSRDTTSDSREISSASRFHRTVDGEGRKRKHQKYEDTFHGVSVAPVSEIRMLSQDMTLPLDSASAPVMPKSIPNQLITPAAVEQVTGLPDTSVPDESYSRIVAVPPLSGAS